MSTFMAKGVNNNGIIFFAEPNFYGELLPNGTIMIHLVDDNKFMRSERVKILEREFYVDEDALKVEIEYKFISEGKKVVPESKRKVLMSELLNVCNPYLQQLGCKPTDLNDTSVVKQIIRKLGE